MRAGPAQPGTPLSHFEGVDTAWAAGVTAIACPDLAGPILTCLAYHSTARVDLYLPCRITSDVLHGPCRARITAAEATYYELPFRVRPVVRSSAVYRAFFVIGRGNSPYCLRVRTRPKRYSRGMAGCVYFARIKTLARGRACFAFEQRARHAVPLHFPCAKTCDNLHCPCQARVTAAEVTCY